MATGRRNTTQRRAIFSAFERHDRPLSPQEVLAAAQEQVPTLGIATVYRTLKLMVDDGALVQVEIAGEPPRYELAGKRHHHHFHCQSCGRLFEVEGCLEAFRQLTPPGFELSGHDLMLSGRCRQCVAAGRRPRDPGATGVELPADRDARS